MAEEQDQIDNDDIDETAVKAAEIGKIIGAEDNKNPSKDEAPDYEIEEENDERIAKERTSQAGATSERKKLTTKEKRDARKRAVDRRLGEKDEINRQLQEQLNVTAARLNSFEDRFSNLDRAKVDDAIGQTKAVLAKAAQDYKAAFSEGDGDKATAAMELMHDAKTRVGQLEAWKQNNSKVTTQQNNGPDPRTVSKAKAWAAKHDWYDASGTDEDSEVAKSISGVLANEGFDPTTDKFWKELDKRLLKRGIIDADETDEVEEDDYEDDEPAAKKPKKRGSPPVSGGSNRGGDAGKVKISLPTRYVNTLKENGIWDDVPRRNRVIQGYLKARREAAAQ